MCNRVKRLSGYLTVEASLLVPMMVVLLIIIMYWSFYIYNNCVVYQDCYISSLRGSQMMDMKESQIENKVKEYAETLLDNQLFQYQKEPEVSVGILSVKVSAKSVISNKTKGLIEQKNDLFTTTREAESKRIDPVWLIRNKY